MNEELFKRLQDQCWIYHTHPDMIDTDSNDETCPCGFDTKKFAELLVQECISAVDSTPLGYGDYRDQIEEAMREACSQSIRNTFGVEE